MLLRKKTVVVFLSSVLMLFLFVWLLIFKFSWHPSPLDKKMHAEFDMYPYDKSFPISALSSVKQFNRVCVLTPYSLDYHTDMRWKNIFGKIDAGKFHDELISNFADGGDYAYGFYLAQNGRLTDTADFYYKKETPFFVEWNFLKEGEGFGAGCYEPSKICLRKTRIPDSQDDLVTVSFCDVKKIEKGSSSSSNKK